MTINFVEELNFGEECCTNACPVRKNHLLSGMQSFPYLGIDQRRYHFNNWTFGRGNDASPFSIGRATSLILESGSNRA